MALTRESVNINPYEKAYEELKNDANFSSTSWETAKRRNQLNQYVGALYTAKEKGVAIEPTPYGYDYDMSKLSNELYSDKEVLKPREFTKIVVDDTGKEKEELEVVEMSDYEYNNKLLTDYSKYKDDSQKQMLEIEQKEARQNFFTTIAATAGEFGLGIVENLDFIDLINAPIDALISGKDYKQAVKDGILGSLSDSLRASLDEYERTHTSLRDINGNYTTVGKMIGGTANSIGRMMPMVLTSSIPGLNAYAGIAQAAYYGSMYQSQVRQMFNDSKFQNVDTFSIVTNSLLKTAIEYGTELLSDKLTGGAGTALDNIVFGRGTGVTKGLSKSAIFVKTISDAVIEGTEEVTAQIANYLLDTMYSAFVNKEFKPNLEDISLEGLMDAYVMGALTSFVMTKGTALMTRRVEINGKKLTKSQSVAYNMNVSNLINNWNNIISNEKSKIASLDKLKDKLSPLEFEKLRNKAIVETRNNLSQATEGLQMLADIHKEMGDIRFASAMKMLQMNQQRLMTQPIETVKDFVKIDMDRYFKATPKGQLVDAVNKKVEELIESGVVATVEVGEIYDQNGKSEQLSQQDSVLYVDGNLLIEGDTNGIISKLVEKQILSLLNKSLSKDVRDFVITSYNEFKGEVSTVEEAMINLMYNIEFAKYLTSQVKDFNKLINKLTKLFEEQVSFKNYKDGGKYATIFKVAIDKMVANINQGNIQQKKEIVTSNDLGNKDIKLAKAKNFKIEYDATKNEQIYQAADNLAVDYAKGNYIGTGRYLTPMSFKEQKAVEKVQTLFRQFFKNTKPSLDNAVGQMFNGNSELFNQYMQDNNFTDPLVAMNTLLKDNKLDFAVISNKTKIQVVSLTDVGKVLKTVPQKGETLIQYLERSKVKIHKDVKEINHLIDFEGMSTSEAAYRSRYVELSDLLDPAIVTALGLNNKNRLYIDVNGSAKVNLQKGADVTLPVNNSGISGYFVNSLKTIVVAIDADARVFTHELAHLLASFSGISTGMSSTVTKELVNLIPGLKQFIMDKFPKIMEIYKGDAGHMLYEMTNGEQWANGEMFKDFTNINMGFEIFLDGTMIKVVFTPTGKTFQISKLFSPAYMEYEKHNAPTLERYTNEDTRRVISKKDSNKNLEFMRKDNGKLQVDQRVKNFWSSADVSKVSAELADMLKSGDLKYNAHNKMTRYFNTADKINKYEFDLFKEYFFKDSKFTTAKQLEDFVTQYMFDFHVVYKLINMYNQSQQETDFFDDTDLKNIMKQSKSRQFSNEASAVLSALDVTEGMSFDQLVKVVNILKADPSLKRDFDNSQMMLQKTEKGYSQVGFMEDSTIMRSAAMRRYKNNLLSANKLYGTFYTTNVKTKTVQTSQLSTSNKDGNTKEFDIGDVTKDYSLEFIQEELQNYITDLAYKNVDNGKITDEQAEAYISKKFKELNKYSTEQLYTIWENLLEKGLIKPNANEQVIVTDSDTRLTTSVRSSIIKLMNKIDQNGITKAKFEKLSKSEQAMFERNKRNKYVVKPEYYYMFTEADADKKSSYNSMVRSNEAEVQREVEAIKQDYRDKLKKTEAALIVIYDKIKKPIKQVIVEVENKQRLKSLESEVKDLQKKILKTKTPVITESTFNINSSTTIPPKFKKLFETEFSKTHKSKTKHVGEGVITERINIQEFRDANADLLNSFTKKEVLEVIEFFESGMIFSGTISMTDLNRMEAFRILTLAHFAQNSHLYGDDPGIKQRINKIAQQTASSDARGLSLWRDVFSAYDPKKAIQDFFASTFSLKLNDSDLENIEKAIITGDTDTIAKETIKLTQLVSDKRSVKNVRNYIGKLTSFRYMSMLSSPATSARNFVSNHTMTGVNTLSEKLSKWLFRKKSMRKGQIDLSVKPSENTKKFLNEKFAFKRKHGAFGPVTTKGEFVDLLTGANKYKFEIGKTSAVNMQQMVVNKVLSDIYGESSFKSTAMKKAQYWIGMMLSDDAFIRKATAKYMAALIENAKIDVTKYDSDFKVKSQVTQFLVDAAALAYYDYMRSDNVFSQIEMLIKNKSESGYLIYKMLFPFAKSSWNFTKELFRMSPFGLTKSLIDLAKLDGKISKAKNDFKYDKGDRGTLPPQFTEFLVKRNIGKGIVGSFLFTVGALIAAFTDLIDFDDDDMAIIIGNTSFDISKVTGTGGLLAGAAFVKSIQGQGSTINIINSLTDQFTEELFFMSVLNNWRYSSGNLSDFTTRQLNSFMSSFIPNILKQFNNTLYNHKVRYNTGALGFIERFATSLIPGLAYALPRQVNIYTGEEQLQYDVPFVLDAINMFSPVKISSYTPSDLEYLSIGLNINKKPLTGKYTVNGKEFKGDSNKANQFYGSANKTQLNALVNNKFKAKVQMPNGSFKELYWSQMTDVQKKNSFTTVMENNATYAKIFSWTDAGHKYYASESEYYKLLKSGVTKNLYRGTKGFVD